MLTDTFLGVKRGISHSDPSCQLGDREPSFSEDSRGVMRLPQKQLPRHLGAEEGFMEKAP